MLLVVQPGGNATPFWPAMMAVASAVCVALRDSATRLMPPRVTAMVATLATTLATTVTGLILALATGSWKPIGFAAVWPLATAAIFVLIANVAMIEAHRDADLSVVSPFRFSVIVWAVLLGIIVFGEWPTPLALAGIVLIAGSGLYTLHREQARRREQSVGPVQ
jgi:drug/metabolite transporter (DMT)-like permease